MDNNQQSPEETPQPYGAGLPGVQPDYAERLAALGVKMTPDGKVKTLGALLREVVDNGGTNLDLETTMEWAARAEVADAEIAALVVDSSQMLKELELFSMMGPGSMAVEYAREGIKHLQTHMENMTFGYLYGVRDGLEARKAIFGPSGTGSGE